MFGSTIPISITEVAAPAKLLMAATLHPKGGISLSRPGMYGSRHIGIPRSRWLLMGTYVGTYVLDLAVPFIYVWVFEPKSFYIAKSAPKGDDRSSDTTGQYLC